MSKFFEVVKTAGTVIAVLVAFLVGAKICSNAIDGKYAPKPTPVVSQLESCVQSAEGKAAYLFKCSRLAPEHIEAVARQASGMAELKAKHGSDADYEHQFNTIDLNNQLELLSIDMAFVKKHKKGEVVE